MRRCVRIATDGWRRLSLAAVAAETGLPILGVYRNFGSKQAILCGFLRRIDEAVLAAPPAPEADERPRDRLFDLLMRRFDALEPPPRARRAAPRNAVRSLERRSAPAAALLRSMRWMLEGADIAPAAAAASSR